MAKHILFCVVVCLPLISSLQAEDEILFNRDIRPILSNNCFQCHGPDATHLEGDLRLDTADGIEYAFGEMNLAKNEAWQRIISDDEDMKMPPPKAHKEVTAAEIEKIKAWIDAGAKYEGHWAFLAPVKPTLPTTKQPAWVKTPIDAFILERLEKEGLSPSEPARREILLRRITFDLTGLPPTIEEIDAFVKDNSPGAYEKVVDRLLASSHYGERMALYWMDAARYGDSSVFHADGPRDMWPWRDWVINSYNENQPFDEFTIQQLAGDLLPNATLDQKIATGFLRNNASTDEGGAIAEEYRVEYAVDRVKTTSMVWMGLSMECAQCHDHKYDPIPQQDYYRFFAYFNQASDPGMQTRKGNQSPIVDVPNLEGVAKAAEIEKQLAEIKKQREARLGESSADYEAWLVKAEKKTDVSHMPGNMLAHFTFDEKNDAKQAKDQIKTDRLAQLKGKPLWAAGKFGNAFQCDGSNYLDAGNLGDFKRDQSFSYGAWIKPQGKGGGAPIAKMDDNGGHRGFDLYISNGNVAVHIINAWPSNALKVTTKASVKPNEWQHIFATYDGSSKANGIKIYFDGKEQPFNVNNNNLTATIQTKTPLQFGRRNPGSPFKGLIDDARIYARKLSPEEVGALAGSDPIGPILKVAAAKRTPEQLKTLRDFYLNNHDKKYLELSKQENELGAKIAALKKPISTSMVMQDVSKPRMTYILDRGNYASPKKDSPVEPGVPEFLGSLPKDAPNNRLGMAQWLTAKEHPLTSRVAVNRFWQMLMGAGLVETSADFGSQGDWPSHPALLDYLAVDFVESGWDVKRAIKQIVMSSTYQQSARLTKEVFEKDPRNRLFARGPRFRLPGEFIRDNALAASGLLVNKIGGPSVKPYQPAGLWNEVALSGNVRFVQDHDEKLYRRSMYTYWKRSAPAPGLTIFDAPTRESCVVQRARTNTPLQALVTLNDPQYVEAGRALAQRVMLANEKPRDQIEHAFRLVTGVRPSDTVLDRLVNAYERELQAFQKNMANTQKLLAIGESKPADDLDPASHAAMSVIGSILLNLDQTLTRG